MNPNMNMHGMSGVGSIGVTVGPSGAIMQSGISPLMQSSPQQPGMVPPQQQQQQQQPMSSQMVASPALQQQQQQQQQLQPAEKLDNISKVKTLYSLMKESLNLAFRGAAFTLQQNTCADMLKRDPGMSASKFDRHLEEFYAYCDQIELHLRTAIMCTQQLGSAQYYLPGQVTTLRTEQYMQESGSGTMPYSTYLNTVRVHIQLAKDIRDTLISASQNISQAD